MLKDGHHQDPRIVAQDFLGAVAVVDVEIYHRHPFELIVGQRVGDAYRQIIEKQKPIALPLSA